MLSLSIEARNSITIIYRGTPISLWSIFYNDYIAQLLILRYIYQESHKWRGRGAKETFQDKERDCNCVVVRNISKSFLSLATHLKGIIIVHNN